MTSNTKDLQVTRQDGFTRRQFIKTTALGIAAAGSGSLMFPDDSIAKPKQIVYANWGGDSVRCAMEAYGKGFTEKTGVKVVIDGTGPLEGKIKDMVEAKNVTWDLAEADPWSSYRLGRQGMLEPIDYSIVDKSKIMAPYAEKYGALCYTFAYGLTYNAKKFGNDAPKSWADFWNIKKYPGKRALYKWMHGALEAALMADGVPPNKLYPLDVARAHKKIKEIKDHLIFWASGSESQQMFLQNEIVMGELWTTRAIVLERDTNSRIGFTWNQAIFSPSPYCVPKGNPAGPEWAMRFIAYAQDPNSQIEYLKCTGQGPANPATNKLLTPELKRINSSDPDNMKLMVPTDVDYYSKHYDEQLNQYLDMIST